MGSYWITKVRSEVPFRIPCRLQSVVLSGWCMKGRIINFTKDDDPSSVYM